MRDFRELNQQVNEVKRRDFRELNQQVNEVKRMLNSFIQKLTANG